MSAAHTSEFDPTYEENFDNTHEYYTQMRAHAPVAHSDAFGGFWAVFRYDDVVRVQTDSVFSTAEKNVVPPATRNQGKRPPLHFDPPEHDIYRRPITPVFGKARMAALEPTLREFADELLDPLVASGRFDFTKDFAEYFAALSFGLILKLPLEQMLRSREVQVDYYRSQLAMDRERVVAASDKLYAIARELVDQRRQTLEDPDEDLISALLLAGERGEAISDDMVVASIRQFLSASQAAPGAVLGSAIVHLCRDEDLQQQLRTNPRLIPEAIEEFLRLYSPYRVFARAPIEDVVVGGRTIAAGEPIAMMFPSANRDESVFDDPHTFRLDRKPNKHIAFGRGPHRCPASALARLELRIALEQILAKTSTIRLDGEVVMSGWLEFGPSATPIAVARPN